MAHPLDVGRSRLRKLIQGSAEALPRLPLVHSTDSFTFADILENGAVTPQACSVFKGEALTYFFYGRPAFRPNANEEPTGLQHYFPVCFVFKLGFSVSISRIFPFDSGAFQDGLYAAYVHKRMALGDFGLEPDSSTPAKVVATFFGSASNYLTGKPTTTQAIDQSEFEALSINALISAKGANNLDGRIASIEIQSAQEISITDAVAAVVLPGTFLDGSIGRTLKNLGVDVLPYRTFDRSKPDDYTTEIANLCINYYIRQKLLAGLGA